MNRLASEVRSALGAVHGAATRLLAREPVALDLRAVTTMTSVIYVCHGDSGRMVDALAEGVRDALRAASHDPIHVEGWGDGQWVLIDAGDLMVHVFLADRRAYYGLERLWHDGRRIDLDAA